MWVEVRFHKFNNEVKSVDFEFNLVAALDKLLRTERDSRRLRYALGRGNAVSEQVVTSAKGRRPDQPNVKLVNFSPPVS